jgi:hypothetical protein
MPTSTDLVTDLPADFETFGQAVATSMADLLGGTTGQVLSKASNTNMDFTWVTTDDANAIQNSIVDAKGDLIAATANDTPARLAVGANDTMLVADSTAATGLAYKSAATLYPWTAWTPTYSAFTVGNGTTIARYQKIGKGVHYWLKFTFGSTSAMGSGSSFSLPSTPAGGNDNAPTMLMRDTGTAWFFGMAIQEGNQVYLNAINTGGTYAQPSQSPTIPFSWTTGDFFTITGIYEEA